jgi:hypothetical protein
MIGGTLSRPAKRFCSFTGSIVIVDLVISVERRLAVRSWRKVTAGRPDSEPPPQLAMSCNGYRAEYGSPPSRCRTIVTQILFFLPSILALLVD